MEIVEGVLSYREQCGRPETCTLKWGDYKFCHEHQKTLYGELNSNYNPDETYTCWSRNGIRRLLMAIPGAENRVAKQWRNGGWLYGGISPSLFWDESSIKNILNRTHYANIKSWLLHLTKLHLFTINMKFSRFRNEKTLLFKMQPKRTQIKFAFAKWFDWFQTTPDRIENWPSTLTIGADEYSKLNSLGNWSVQLLTGSVCTNEALKGFYKLKTKNYRAIYQALKTDRL